MDTFRIKTRIGNSEFEAEGPSDLVKEQFQTFIARISAPVRESPTDEVRDGEETTKNEMDTVGSRHVSIDKVLHVSGRVVSLTALPQSIDDAALLIMLGHRDLRNNHAVTGQEIGDGLAQSGRPVPRVDRVMDKAITEALVLKSGIRRSTRYRLTNSGLVKALNIADSLIKTLP